MVPVILLMLKELLVSLGGYESEGIFRKAGLESEMTTLKEHINNGNPFTCYNQHTIATLLKVIFKFIFLYNIIIVLILIYSVGLKLFLYVY